MVTVTTALLCGTLCDSGTVTKGRCEGKKGREAERERERRKKDVRRRRRSKRRRVNKYEQMESE